MPFFTEEEIKATDLAPRFETHRVYIDFIRQKSIGLTFSKYPSLLGRKDTDDYSSKIRLIRLTQKSIEDEIALLEADNDYGQPASIWLPVKSYYLLYHCLTVLRYLVTGTNEHLRGGHGETLRWMADQMRAKSIEFTAPEFNEAAGQEIHGKKILDRSGELFTHGCDEGKKRQLILRKAFTDKAEEEKRKKRYSLRKPADRNKFNIFLAKSHVTFFDFFYCTRIRTNYRDVDFIDGVLESRVAAYARTWGTAAKEISGAFEPFF